MAERYGFHINSRVCSGCKTCQVACKDRSNLKPGQNWRRIYEIEGGEWKRESGAWSTLPWSYNLSIACNHCSDPACVNACPTTAMHIDSTGIVLIDSDKCMGCGYCMWACPYEAPRPDPETGKMSKCDMCIDLVTEGKRPVCVDSCPMRALDFGTMDQLSARYGDVGEVWPLPSREITAPSIVITAHSKAALADTKTAIVANREEVEGGKQ